MTTILGLLNTVLFLALAIAFLYKYRQTRDPGLLWLGVPLVVLPAVGMIFGIPISHWMGSMVDKLSSGQPIGSFPFSLVESGRITLGTLIETINATKHLFWTALVFVGVLMLHHSRPPESQVKPQS